MKSIIQKEKECFLTGSKNNLHKHHVYEGYGKRNLSEKYGLWIWLREDWHDMSDYSIHFDERLNRRIKGQVQEIAMKHYNWTKEEFIKIFGRNYIE